MKNLILLNVIGILCLSGCSGESFSKKSQCEEIADIAETVMTRRLNDGHIGNSIQFLTGGNEQLKEQLLPYIRDAYSWDRGGAVNRDAKIKAFRDQYYSECINSDTTE